ncbi:MAG: protein-L-isoaspartate(D-aspartate) O-methyltransferase [Elusimicrobiota bacterium]
MKYKDNSIYSEERKAMVQNQIIHRGVSDIRVLNVMEKVPRHLFVPENMISSAYTDNPLPIGYDQTISQPYIVALMTELLELDGSEKVLEIGTGSGYQAAVLAELADEVYTIEIVDELAEQAGAILTGLGYANIKVKSGDGFLGWPEYAPFDAIIVTCAPENIPGPLIKQLAEGGRIVIPVGPRFPHQVLKVAEKINGRIIEKENIPVRFVPMTGIAEQE